MTAHCATCATPPATISYTLAVLIPCPECERSVSDRANACPGCGFPVNEWKAEQLAAEHASAVVASRERVGEVDCPACAARGFVHTALESADGETQEKFFWCSDCEHSGRVPQCSDLDGYYAVAFRKLDDFLDGRIDAESEGVHALGAERATTHRYPQAGERHEN